MCVLHRCDNPRCVNPGHLFLGTKKDNAIDREQKNRGARMTGRGEKSGTAKVNAGQVMEIRASSDLLANIAAQYGISETQVWRIKHRRQWSHL